MIGHYETIRIPFGLKNAPSTIRRVIDNIFRGLNNDICLNHLDDILTHIVSMQENISQHRIVIVEKLRRANFKI